MTSTRRWDPPYTVMDLHEMASQANLWNNIPPNADTILTTEGPSIIIPPRVTAGVVEMLNAIVNALGNLTSPETVLVAGPTPATAPPVTTPPPSGDFFPPDPTQAPTSPENSEQLILNGAVNGPPYLKDSNGTIHQLKISATGDSEYWVNGASQMANWANSSNAPPAELLVRQSGVYIFLTTGITQQFRGGAIYNTSVPPPFTSGGTVPLPALPPLPTPSTVAPGSTGHIIHCGSGQALATLSAAIPTAAAGDTILLAAGSYTDTPPAWTVPLLIDLGGATFDATGHTATLARDKGLLVPAADSVIQNGTITGVAMDQGSGQLTSAIRPDAGCGYLTIKNIVAHGNQCGIGHGGFPIVIGVSGGDISGNGLTANSGSLTHNLYVGKECRRLTLDNVISINPVEAHAVKYRGPELIVNGGTLEAVHGSCIDLPDGSTVQAKITGATIIKPANADDHKILNYAEESQTNGLAGMLITGGSIAADCPNPAINGNGGTVTLSGVALSGGSITATGGVVLVVG